VFTGRTVSEHSSIEPTTDVMKDYTSLAPEGHPRLPRLALPVGGVLTSLSLNTA
jgi:hypothetical protein